MFCMYDKRGQSLILHSHFDFGLWSERTQIYVLNADSFTYTYIKYIPTNFSHYAKFTSSEIIRSG